MKDEEAYKKYALDGRLHLEACKFLEFFKFTIAECLGPLSSVMTAAVAPEWTEHPVKRWAKDGANYSISTDDPTCFDNSLASELALATEKIGLTDLEIWQCVSF